MMVAWQDGASSTPTQSCLSSSTRPRPPTAVREPRLIAFNSPLAAMLGLAPGALEGPEGAAMLAGNTLPAGARPIAQAYAGHQYGNFVNLGDGRAILLGEQLTPQGERFDIQTQRPRPSDALFPLWAMAVAALGPMLREYIISEAMHALGLPTTRALRSPPPASLSIATRQACPAPASPPAICASAPLNFPPTRGPRKSARPRRLHPPPPLPGNPARPPNLCRPAARPSSQRQALVIARWQGIGFVDGIMNTDNMAPSAKPSTTVPARSWTPTIPPPSSAPSITTARDAYANQPQIAQWNLGRLAEAMLPLFDSDMHSSWCRWWRTATVSSSSSTGWTACD